MSALSNYAESGLINHILRGIAYTAPTTVYVGLVKGFNSGNLESGIVDEPSSGGYTRQSYASNTGNWITPYTSGSATVTHNSVPIEFPVASSTIGDISGVFISDSSSGGNVLFYGQLSSARNVREGDQFVFSSGALKISFN